MARPKKVGQNAPGLPGGSNLSVAPLAFATQAGHGPERAGGQISPGGINDVFLVTSQVQQRYACSEPTLRAWQRDRGFPKPTYLGRFRRWRLSALQAWEAAQA
jgi:predicted DNA-binding transcriptional regulator AlpA